MPRSLRELLHLLGAPRLRVALSQTAAGTWQGRLLEAGLTYAADSPAQALRTLAQALEADAAPPGHA